MKIIKTFLMLVAVIIIGMWFLSARKDIREIVMPPPDFPNTDATGTAYAYMDAAQKATQAVLQPTVDAFYTQVSQGQAGQQPQMVVTSTPGPTLNEFLGNQPGCNPFVGPCP